MIQKRLDDMWAIYLKGNLKQLFRKIIHRHVWRPLRTEYRYRSYETGRMVTVKRCQCRGCGRIDWFHFDGKEIIY